MPYRIINGKPYAIGTFPDNNSRNLNNVNKSSKEENSFKSILNEKLNPKKELSISNHAALRIKELNLDALDMKVLKDGIDMAEKKGSKNSVIIYKDIAFVASVENRTLITAVDKERAKENVFTNIDSVIIL